MAQTGVATKENLPAVFSLLEEGGLPKEGLWEHLETILVAREGCEVVGSAALELQARQRCCARWPSVGSCGAGVWADS